MIAFSQRNFYCRQSFCEEHYDQRYSFAQVELRDLKCFYVSALHRCDFFEYPSGDASQDNPRDEEANRLKQVNNRQRNGFNPKIVYS